MAITCYLMRATEAELESYLQNRLLLGENTIMPGLYDIDQSWDGIIYLLTGQSASDNPHPLAAVLFSRQQIPVAGHSGIKAVHYLRPPQVKALNDRIGSIGEAQFRKGFDPAKMHERGIYPRAWHHPAMSDYLYEYFETVQEAYALAAKNEEALITFLR